MDAALDALMHDENSSGEYRLELKSVPVRCFYSLPDSSVVAAHAAHGRGCCTASGFPMPLALGCRRLCPSGMTLRCECGQCVCVCARARTDGGLWLGL